MKAIGICLLTAMLLLGGAVSGMAQRWVEPIRPLPGYDPLAPGSPMNPIRIVPRGGDVTPQRYEITPAFPDLTRDPLTPGGFGNPYQLVPKNDGSFDLKTKF